MVYRRFPELGSPNRWAATSQYSHLQLRLSPNRSIVNSTIWISTPLLGKMGGMGVSLARLAVAKLDGIRRNVKWSSPDWAEQHACCFGMSNRIAKKDN